MGKESLIQTGGVIAASAGNHALALAYHGQDLGVPVTVVMPRVAPLSKIDKCRKFGAKIIIEGNHVGEAKEYAQQTSEGKIYVNGYDDPEIIAGAGTMGIEIIEDVPCVDAVVVPVGGAGLIAGVACCSQNTEAKRICFWCRTRVCSILFKSFRKGETIVL